MSNKGLGVELVLCDHSSKDIGLYLNLLHWLYSPRGPWPLFQFHDHFTDGRTPWASDQLVERSLPKYRTTQTQNKHIHTPNIHDLCGIRTHDPRFRASEDSIFEPSCFILWNQYIIVKPVYNTA
jgi:hypothetical protein